jgi:hypothetical protein
MFEHPQFQRFESRRLQYFFARNARRVASFRLAFPPG